MGGKEKAKVKGKASPMEQDIRGVETPWKTTENGENPTRVSIGMQQIMGRMKKTIGTRLPSRTQDYWQIPGAAKVARFEDMQDT